MKTTDLARGHVIIVRGQGFSINGIDIKSKVGSSFDESIYKIKEYKNIGTILESQTLHSAFINADMAVRSEENMFIGKY